VLTEAVEHSWAAGNGLGRALSDLDTARRTTYSTGAFGPAPFSPPELDVGEPQWPMSAGPGFDQLLVVPQHHMPAAEAASNTSPPSSSPPWFPPMVPESFSATAWPPPVAPEPFIPLSAANADLLPRVEAIGLAVAGEEAPATVALPPLSSSPMPLTPLVVSVGGGEPDEELEPEPADFPGAHIFMDDQSLGPTHIPALVHQVHEESYS